jgi:hypothetical protein
MRTMKLARIIALATMVAGAVHAGPAIACNWVAVPGSVFETLSSMREQVYAADDSHAKASQARTQLAELRAAIKADDPLSLLRAGFWATAMQDIGVVPDTDGPALILRALALRPNDPEYQLFAALSHLDKDKAAFRKYWERARQLAKPGSAADINIRVITKQYPALTD